MKPYGRPTGWRNKIHDTNKCGICAETRVIKKKSRQNELMVINEQTCDVLQIYRAPFLQLTPSKLLKATWPIKVPTGSYLARVESKANGEVDYIFEGGSNTLEDRYFTETFTLLFGGLMRPELELALSYEHPSLGTTFVYETKKPAI